MEKAFVVRSYAGWDNDSFPIQAFVSEQEAERYKAKLKTDGTHWGYFIEEVNF